MTTRITVICEEDYGDGIDVMVQNKEGIVYSTEQLKKGGKTEKYIHSQQDVKIVERYIK